MLLIKFLYFCLAGKAEAQENRNFIITKLSDDIIEIMRVLQLKVGFVNIVGSFFVCFFIYKTLCEICSHLYT